ncbi:helix-turn-helix transcriptional regulator [Elizabethkingia anophelis]|uniref:helix-turn-helix transcriptional regulator n=1 Tax=Elizabethkingia anophelis TaxID=1117645 RepID=UPI00293CE24C|nr:transcriptional regulator [Elizabethkingia anophelis]
MELRIKEICKRKGIEVQELADKIGITRQALHARAKNNPTMKTITEIAKLLDVSIFELIGADSKTYHSYSETGEWMGVLKKNN